MAGNEYSKKMCHELLLLEDYLMTCKSASFQKDKIVVDKYKVLEVITSLRSYHCSDRTSDNPAEGKPAAEEKPVAEKKAKVAAAAGEEQVQTFIINKDKPVKKEEPVERRVTPKVQTSEDILHNDQELIQYMEKKRAEAMKALEEEIAARREEEEQKLMNRVKNAQMIADQSLEKSKASHEESAAIIISDAEMKAKQILSEAKINADYMISQAETKAHVKQEEMDALLNEKIAEAERKAEEIIVQAQAQAEAILEQNAKDAADVTLAGYKRAEGFIEQAEDIYAQQLGVVKTDREALSNILKRLEESN